MGKKTQENTYKNSTNINLPTLSLRKPLSKFYSIPDILKEMDLHYLHREDILHELLPETPSLYN